MCDQINYYVKIIYFFFVIKVVCVDEDFRECNLDRVYLNESFDDGGGKNLNDFIKDYFYCVKGLFCYFCFVYKYSVQIWYLQYVDNYWVVIVLYVLNNYDDKIYMRVKDFVIRFEYISKMWFVYYNGWCDMFNFRVLCRGVILMLNICLLRLCDSKVICIYILGNEIFCFCFLGYMGLICFVNEECFKLFLKVNIEVNFVYLGK